MRQPGGMLAIGDMHASMGDGEICLTGVEISGEVTIRFDLLKGKHDANICQACRPQPFSTIARIAIPKIAAAPKPFA